MQDNIRTIKKAQDIMGGVAVLIGNANDPLGIFNSSNKIGASKAMAAFKGWTYASVRAVAEEVMNANISLMKYNPDGTSEEVLDHELLDLLDN